MNISHLKYAIAVEKEGSINKAAKALRKASSMPKYLAAVAAMEYYDNA